MGVFILALVIGIGMRSTATAISIGAPSSHPESVPRATCTKWNPADNHAATYAHLTALG